MSASGWFQAEDPEQRLHEKIDKPDDGIERAQQWLKQEGERQRDALGIRGADDLGRDLGEDEDQEGDNDGDRSEYRFHCRRKARTLMMLTSKRLPR